ncbi:hypothetical protein TNCV_4499071 [Trichonephila clavipes]|nr:hypothetical protein TNCV_4499071 [Trichonephila clavipes]
MEVKCVEDQSLPVGVMWSTLESGVLVQVPSSSLDRSPKLHYQQLSNFVGFFDFNFRSTLKQHEGYWRNTI